MSNSRAQAEENFEVIVKVATDLGLYSKTLRSIPREKWIIFFRNLDAEDRLRLIQKMRTANSEYALAIEYIGRISHENFPTAPPPASSTIQPPALPQPESAGDEHSA